MRYEVRQQLDGHYIYDHEAGTFANLVAFKTAAEALAAVGRVVEVGSAQELFERDMDLLTGIEGIK